MTSVDLSQHFPPITNQHDTRMCVSVAAASVREYYSRLQQDNTALSSQFLHYNSRRARPDFQQYTGTTIDDVLLAMIHHGVAPQADCEICIENPNAKPSTRAYANAEDYKIRAYKRLLSFDDVIESFQGQHPVLFIIGVYSTFYADATVNNGQFIEPPRQYKPTHSHCVVAVGVDTDKKMLKVRNSAGKDWGDNGHFYLPFHLAKQKRIAGYYRSICV